MQAVNQIISSNPFEILHKLVMGEDAIQFSASIQQNPTFLNHRRIEDGLTPLGLAALSGREWAVELLLKNGANPLIPDNSFVTPWEHARARQNDTISSIFLRYHPNLPKGDISKEMKLQYMLNAYDNATLKAHMDRVIQQNSQNKIIDLIFENKMHQSDPQRSNKH